MTKLILRNYAWITTLSILLILLIIEGLTGIPLHQSAGFVVCLSAMMLVLLFVVWKRMRYYSLKNTAFLLMHAGLFMVLLFGCLGSSRFHKLHVRAFPETPENIAYNDEYSLFELPFQLTLKNFKSEFYNNGQPKSYKAEIRLKNAVEEESAILAINRPVRFMGYDVYLESYDQIHPENPEYVVFLTVYDRYGYAKYFSIILILIGLCLNIGCLPYSKNRVITLFILLFGLGFSMLPFGKYLFGGQHLVPALQSVWFVPHIAVYMLAYGALTAACLLSLFTLFNRKKDVQIPLDFSLNIGVSLMGIGLLFGALWAKSAWGNFWSFDLKETWAAIAWFAFLGVVHFRYRFGHQRKILAILIIAAFILLQMCWFGVNYLPEVLQSLHRY